MPFGVSAKVTGGFTFPALDRSRTHDGVMAMTLDSGEPSVTLRGSFKLPGGLIECTSE